MPEDREPYNIEYCRAVNCLKRHGNKCEVSECIRQGSEKYASYFTTTGKLVEGDVPDA